LNAAKICFEKKQLPRARELLSKANAILSELIIALDHAVLPDLCGQLEALYAFSIDRIVAASRKADTVPIDEVTRVLTPLREAWILAVPKAHAEAHQK
jgi:flagellar protein FliS